MQSEFWAAIAGAIVGALVGAIPAFFLAERNSRKLLERDAKSRKLQRQGLTQRLVVKLLVFMDMLGDLKRHLDEEFAKKDSPGRTTFEPWQLILPMSGQGSSNLPAFTADELEVLFEMREYDLMQQLMLFERRCSSAYANFKEFCDRRDALQSIMPTPVKWDGDIATTLMTEEQINHMKQYTIPLNTLILGLREHMAENWTQAETLAEELTAFARTMLEQPSLTIIASRE